MRQVKKFLSNDLKIAIILLFGAVILRTIPEIRAGIWPIGYDTFNTYAAELATYSGPLINWLKTANFIFFLFLPFKLIGISPDVIIKIFGPLFYGALAVAFYAFLRAFLKFSMMKSFLITLFLVLQVAALRLSWDLYRNELGLIFLLLALIQAQKIVKPINFVLFVIFSALVVLSHQLITVILLLILLGYLVKSLIKHKYDFSLKFVFVLLMVLGLFLWTLNSSGQALFSQHIFFTTDKNVLGSFLYRYKALYPYKYLAQNIWYLFYLFYGLLLPLIILGFWNLRKNIALTIMTLWLLLGTFSPLIFGGIGLIVWERWLFMLVIPFSIYAVEGAYQLADMIKTLKIPWAKYFRRKRLAYGIALTFWLIVFGFCFWQAYPFLVKNYQEAKAPLANDELNNYFPRTMVHNSVGLAEIEKTKELIKWIDQKAPKGSLIIVDNRYRGLMMTQFEIDDRYILTTPWSEAVKEDTFKIARSYPQRPIYLIWNITRSIDGFDRIYAVGNRGVYEALPSFYESSN